MDQQFTETSSNVRKHDEDEEEDQTESERSSNSCCCSHKAVVTVLLCTVIFSSFTLVNHWITDFNYAAVWGETGNREVKRAYNGVSSLTTIFAALLSLKVGYRVVAISGCLMMMSSLFVSSWLDKDTIGLIGFLVGGIAGVGASCVKLAAVVPVLENIQNCRFIAVAIVNIGGAGASVVHYGILASSWVSDDVDLNWKHFYRWQLLVMSFALLASTRLQPSSEKWIKNYFSPFDWSVLREKSLYIMMVILLCDRFGHLILSNVIFTFFDKNENFAAPYLGGFFYYGGQIFGPMFLFCCIKKQIAPTLRFMGSIDLIAGVWTIAATWSTNLFHISMYAGTLGISKAAFTTLLQNLIPSVFGKNNVRIVQGLLDFGAGVGILLSSPCQNAVEMHYDEADRYKPAFYLAGSFLVLASAFVFICLRVVKAMDSNADVAENKFSEIAIIDA
ncbi:uncharacterized protein LOC110445384 isoform X2 [Mizuhopecten yessoensis]|uniref:Monocarboxylate transporter 12 n=1 Tax=Mizuhopecten yessoensis TaxID=6573 RepID=A0A210QZP4_MIZYE|nr:uncharacterized protein LOC110445384 isoform X2 [Mizuhopecten yessoensis]OWF54239.1 hypothetical protein KP79_PYT10913 [Mizuhopecten yessoensis]